MAEAGPLDWGCDEAGGVEAGGVEVVIEDPRWEAAGLEALAQDAVAGVLRHLGRDPRDFEVAVLGGDDARVASLNAAFRGREAPTNVLAWPSAARDPARPPEGGALGDVALSYDTCAAEAAAQGKALPAHATHLIVHAVLHLLGHDHGTDAEASLMEDHERAILAAMGLPDPYAPPSGPAGALAGVGLGFGSDLAAGRPGGPDLPADPTCETPTG